MSTKKPGPKVDVARSSAAAYLTFIAATGEDERSIEMRYQDENIWLTQKMMAALYDVTVAAVNQHLKRVFDDGELSPEAVIKAYLITASDGKSYNTKHYNLQAIVAVGFKVNNPRAVQFRKWAGQIVKDYTIQGWAMDVERLKKGHMFTDEYFDRQLAYIREIRLSERKFYQKVTDLYATAFDYDASAQTTREFFALVQNKLHWATHRHTAAELIVARADAGKQHMGLSAWEAGPSGNIHNNALQVINQYEADGAANSNTSTAVLQKQLEDPNARIIITTIQKLSRFVAKNKQHPVYAAHVVVIFDECHRSQFGDMHAEITRVFQRYHLFGFTGTPIFAENSGTGGNPLRRTTTQAFGDKLHTYTIVDAINDKNVLPFRIDYINTIKTQAGIKDKQVPAIDTERALLAPERISQIVAYIREHFDQKTKRASSYRHDGQRLAGFNSLFACASIDAAKRYYAEFHAQQKDRPEAQRLKVGLIYSFTANEEESDGLLGEEEFETEGLDASSRDFLDTAIQGYNALFGTSFDTSADKFQNYYKDLSQRLKKRELDIVIVVNMFLTGFDATTLNTLWADKNLKAHGLIQAYSRTNRILNSVKTYGNIVSFRNLEQATNDALALFGNKDAKGIVLLKPYAEYYQEYQARVGALVDGFPLGQAIVGEAAQKAFIKLFGAILRLKNILTAFDDFAEHEILTQREFQDYQSLYLNLYAEFRATSAAEKESINDDVVFEIELIKQVEINVDYILLLVEQYLKKKGTGDDKEIRATIERAINSSPSLRNKRDLIEEFIDSVSPKAKVDAQWQAFVAAKKVEELERIISEENLNAEAARSFIDNAFRDGGISTTGTAITKILPPVSRFNKSNSHAVKKQTVLDKLAAFFERHFGLA